MFPLIAAAGGSIGALIVGFLMLLVAVAWIIFPFIVNSKFNELIHEQRMTNQWLAKIAGNSAPPDASRGPSTALGMTEGKMMAGDTPAATPAKEPNVYKL